RLRRAERSVPGTGPESRHAHRRGQSIGGLGGGDPRGGHRAGARGLPRAGEERREAGEPVGQDRRREAEEVLPGEHAAGSAVRAGPGHDGGSAGAGGIGEDGREHRRAAVHALRSRRVSPDPMAGSDLKYRRVVLKLSGEALAGDAKFGISPPVVDRLTDEIQSLHRMGVSLGLVIGGGNIVRGTQASAEGMDRVSADYMGMLATVINALALQDLLDRKGVDTRV